MMTGDDKTNDSKAATVCAGAHYSTMNTHRSADDQYHWRQSICSGANK